MRQLYFILPIQQGDKMPTNKETTLQSLFPGNWEENLPNTLVELVKADYDTLPKNARDLRALAMLMVHAFERKPVHTAKAALELLEAHHLSAPKGKWNIVALGADRERTYERIAGTNLRLVHFVSTTMPDAKLLSKKAPIPDGGTYLILRGGSPDIMSDTETLKAYRQLKKALPVADIILWEDQGDSATFWSIGAGVGQCGTSVMNFPDQELLQKWKS
jgi:hypothetical protein